MCRFAALLLGLTLFWSPTVAHGDHQTLLREATGWGTLEVTRAPFRPNAVDALPDLVVRPIIDNERVTVWDHTFTSGKPSPMHFHDKDVVVTYMADGALTSTTADGQSQTNENTFGLTKFNGGNRTHTEQLVRGKLRVIAVELK